MSRTTLANAKAELVARLSTNGVSIVTGLDAVYDHLPPTSALSGPTSAAVFTAAITADFWHIALRVFMESAADTKEAQDNLDALLPRIDAATATGGFGPAAWDFAYPGSGEQHYTVTCVYAVGRQDI